MTIDRWIDIASMILPFVILWQITLIAYVKMRCRYMRAMKKYIQLAGSKEISDPAYRRYLRTEKRWDACLRYFQIQDENEV